MPIKKTTYLMLLLMLACITGSAQLSSFGFSALGSSNGSIVSTSPVVVSGTVKCLSVTGGVGSLTIANNGAGLFESACKESVPVADTTTFSLTLNVYPNPTRGATMLKAAGSFDQNLSCLVRVIAIDGKVMMNQLVPMSSLKAGYSINASAYAQGQYNVVVELLNKRYTLRLIKY